MSAKVHVKKGDLVVVISGKNKGAKGKVTRVVPETNRVVVEGVNMVKRHQKPNPRVMQSGIIEKEAPLHASNVMLFCSKCDRPRRAAHKIQENGTKIRVCHECGESFDK